MSDSTANTPDARKPEPLDHFVSQAPFDAQAATLLTPEQEKYYLSSQWRLMWLKFRRHKLALWSGIYLILVYASILISEVIAPYSFTHRHTDFIYAPPQEVRLFHDGSLIGPYVYPYDEKLNMEELRWDYTEDTSNPQKLRFLCTSDDYAGSTYEFWGLFESNFHLVCPAAGGQFFFLGTDRLGRDIQSRIIQGAKNFQPGQNTIGTIIFSARGLGIQMAAGANGRQIGITRQTPGKQIANTIGLNDASCRLCPLGEQRAGLLVLGGQGLAIDPAFRGCTQLRHLFMAAPQAVRINRQAGMVSHFSVIPPAR